MTTATLTATFPPGIDPVHKGVYKTKFRLTPANPFEFGYSYWNGKRWSNQWKTIDLAHERGATDGAGFQNKYWQGLTEEQK